MVSVSPYCGVPRLSHQLPVDVVVTAVVTAAVDVVDGVAEVVLEVGVDVVVSIDVVVDVDVDVVDLAHDARTNDDTMRQVSTIQITPLFILTSCFI